MTPGANHIDHAVNIAGIAMWGSDAYAMIHKALTERLSALEAVSDVLDRLT